MLFRSSILRIFISLLLTFSLAGIALADTIGMATADQIKEIYPLLCTQFPQTELGIHLHAPPDAWYDKIEAAYLSGCKRFDTALKGYGGCPMAKDELTGNIATENLISYLKSQNEPLYLDYDKLQEAMDFSVRIFL